MSKHDHEYLEAARFLKAGLDLSNPDLLAIGDLLGPSLVRLHWRFWAEQDRWNPDLVYDPADIAYGTSDPTWFQTDGWPEQGGSTEDIVSRKWRRRADLWLQFHLRQVWHIVDWLLYARREDAAWLKNLDAQGHPKKLMKCGDLGALLAEADKGLRTRPKPGGDIVLGIEDEVFVADLGASHTLVQLLSPRALRKEGSRMHNCLRNGDYGCRLGELFQYFSVRNPDGRPLATLELMGSTVIQFAGLLNTMPVPEVRDLMSAFAEEIGWVGLLEAIVVVPDLGVCAVDVPEPAASAPGNRRRI